MARSNLVSISVGYPMPLQIILKNTQSVDSPSPFQQMLQLEASEINSVLPSSTPQVASDFHNIRFKYNYSYIPAWLESISNGIATIWVKLPVSIPANSSITIDMEVDPSLNFDGNYWGEAPLLSPTYGEYDNGTSVFNFYDNFAGTSLKPSWSTLLPSYAGTTTVNNGLTLSGGTNWWGLENSYQTPMPSVLEVYGENTESSGYGIGPGIGTYNGAVYLMREPTWCIQNTTNGYPQTILASGGTANFNVWYLVSGIYNSGSLSLMVNYATVTSYSLTVSSSNLELITYTNSTSVFQYARVRAYPPDGVMPSVEVIA